MTEETISETSLARFINENAVVAEVGEAIAAIDGVTIGSWGTPGDDITSPLATAVHN
jgi:hypothetical protein